MTPDQEKQFFRENQFTFKGRMFFPNLLTPKPNQEGTRTNYNVMFAFRPEENAEMLNKLNAFLTQVYSTWYSTVPMQFFVNPLKKFETYQKQDGRPNAEYLRGTYWFNAATGMTVPPAVFKQGPMNTFITLTPADEAELWSGRNAVIQVSFYKIKEKKQGLSTNVNTVLLLEGGNKEAGFVQVDPAKAFGAFATDMGVAPQAGFGAQPQYGQAVMPNGNPVNMPHYHGQPLAQPQYVPQAPVAPMPEQYTPPMQPAQPAYQPYPGQPGYVPQPAPTQQPAQPQPAYNPHPGQNFGGGFV